MKNKKSFCIIFLGFSVLYHIIYEGIIFLLGIEIESDFILTPLGRLFRSIILKQNIEVYYKPEVYVFLFNTFVCAILYVISFSWFTHFNTLKTLFKLIIAYVVISIVVWIFISWSGKGLGTIGLYVLFFLLPILSMVILTIPYYWIISRYFFKTHLNEYKE